jgi:hypothetical protein
MRKLCNKYHGKKLNYERTIPLGVDGTLFHNRCEFYFGGLILISF